MAADSLYLESRYRKFLRGLPQTIYHCPTCRGGRWRRRRCDTCHGRGKLSEESVQELLGRRLLPAFRAQTGKFHGAGREDIDVCMLGRGRPFVYEVVGARRDDVDLAELVVRLNREEDGRISIDPFQVVDRARVAALKESNHDKRYRLGVKVDGAFDADRLASLIGVDMSIAQRTPLRVAHRRGDLVRPRRVLVLASRPGADGDAEIDFELDVETAGGTYVKEWVSGDQERTVPSLASWLGVTAACARLDVLEILDDREPSASSGEELGDAAIEGEPDRFAGGGEGVEDSGAAG
jgi:tRNA pseudouridine synthase 10